VTTTFNATTMAPADRAEAIREMIWSSVVRVEIEHPHPQDISTQMSITDLGRLNVCSMTSNPTTLQRTARLSKDELTPSLFLGLQVSGSSVVVQGGREAVLGPGDLAMCATTAPYTLLNGNGIHQQHIFRILLTDLALPAEAISAVTAIRLGPERPVANLAATYFRRLATNVETLPADCADALAPPSIELVRALITTQLADHRLAREPLARTLELRVMEYLRAHLADRDLSAARIAGQHHISVRHLYTILGRSGILLGDWVRTQRLEECRRDLAKPGADSRTIAFIGQRWGFGDPTNFGRAFKTAYGLSPRDWRDLHQPDTETCARSAE
jgi:AraC-like DNA-binding protein